MRTIFKGTVNGQTFDNVQDYNAEIQKCLANGTSINAESHTETAPEVADTNFLFPGFAHCKDIASLDDKFIDGALQLEADQFINDVSALFHDRIKPAIEEMPKEKLSLYKNLVAGIRKYLDELANKSMEKTAGITKRLQEIEDEIETLREENDVEEARKSVIDFVSDLYEDIAGAIEYFTPRMIQCVPGVAGCACDTIDPEPETKNTTPTTGAQYIEDIKAKARKLFGL